MKRRFGHLESMRAFALVAALALAGAQQASAAAWQQLKGHVPKPVAAGLQPLSKMPATNHLRLAISLPLRNQDQLNALLQQMYDPNSPNYHHYLTPRQFADEFGPTAGDYLALQAYALSNHIQITGTHPNRTVLDVDMSAADAERLFRVQLNVYKHPTENRTFFAPSSEPSIGAPIPVLHIDGLSDYQKPKPLSHLIFPGGAARPTGSQPLGTGSGPFGTFLGYDFRDAYMPAEPLTGTGQSVALLELDGYYASDITAYRSLANVPVIPMTNILIDGFNGLPYTSSGNGECSLDIEMVNDMAPGLTSMLVYEATNNGVDSIITDLLNRMATDDLANQITSSWLLGDSPTWDQIYIQYALQGQTFLQASGDNGAFVWSDPNQQHTDDPYITLVGGTTLTTTGPLGSWSSERVWNWNTTGGGTDASGGGISPNYKIPTWQAPVSMKNNQGSTVWRNIPDVALTADNIWVLYGQGQSGDFGGTSCAAPLWSGVVALMNQQATNVDKPKVGFLNPYVYTIGLGPLYGSAFHDITVGNDTNAESPSEFFAAPGYDLCTGWGTPTGSNLINAVVPPTLSPVLAVWTNLISGGNGNGVINYDECMNLTVVLTNEGTAEATSITATLSSLTPGVIVAQPSTTFSDLPVHFSGSCLTPFKISTVPEFVCGTPVDLMMVVKSQQTTETNMIALSSGILGTPDTISNNYSQTGPNFGLPIPVNFTGTNSTIVVSNLESIGHITVSVNLQALYDEGIVLQLTSPNGTSVLLSQNNGGLGANYGEGCVPAAQTTFDDSASVPIVDGTPPYLGSFQPMQPLSVYNLANGTNLNGPWTLNIMDEFPGDTATLECWSLNISPEICEDGGGQCPGAALSLSMASLPSTVTVNSNYVYQMVVSNAGPSVATNVIISQTLPQGVFFVAATNYPAGVSVNNNTNVVLTLGQIPVYGTAVVDVVAYSLTQGLLTSVATVGSPEPNPTPNSATASATTLVQLPSADLAVSIAASPGSVLEGAPVTYTINVTNNGPSLASNVLLNVTLPNANVISTSTSQGVSSPNGLNYTLGPVAMGVNARVTIVALPTATGNLMAGAVVSLAPSSGQQDPNIFNNSAEVTITVGPSADLAVSATVSPNTILSGTNFTYVATVVNNGPSSANSVNLNQSIPNGATLVSSSQSYVLTNGIVNWSIGNLAVGGAFVVTNVFQAPTLLSGVSAEALISTFNVFGQPGDPYTNNNSVTLQALVEPPTVTILPVSAALLSVANQPSDGSIHPGGTVTVQLNLQNTGNISTTNLVATLQATGGVGLPSGAQTYGAIAPGATLGRNFSFTAQSANGGSVVATLQLQDGTATLKPAVFTFNMPNVYTFANTNPIYIPDLQYVPEPDSGPASPYPASIAVTNISGYVSKVTVTVSNLTHSYPHDIGLLLVGPGGQNTILMSAAAEYSSISGATLTFDELLGSPIPATGPMVTGTYCPTNYNPTNLFVTNAAGQPPAGPYTANLSLFTGLNANGTWSLYGNDDAPGDAGEISNGWLITVTTISPVNTEADLGVTVSESSPTVALNGFVTNYLSISNNGPNAAPAYLTNTFTSGLALVTSTQTTNYSEPAAGTIVYSLGSMNPGAGLTITNVFTATNGGAQTVAAYCGSAVADPNAANNAASVSCAVVQPPANLVISMGVSTNVVVAGSTIQYTLVVSNAGPNAAIGVAGTFPLAGLSSVSAPSSGQVSCSTNSTSLTCAFSTLAAGATVGVSVTATPTTVGTLTNTWSVTSITVNTNVTSVSTNITVTGQMPVIVANGATLISPAGGNGAINANQTSTVAFSLANTGTAATGSGFTATLAASGGVTPVTQTQTYGAITPGQSASQQFQFTTGSAAPGSTVIATLLLTNGGTSLGAAQFPFNIPVLTNFLNSAEIIIPDVGPATPYPSQILVNLTNAAEISQVTATLYGFAHTFPHDVNVMLVAPSGQELVLMAHAGGPYAVSNLNLTFTDTAAAMVATGQLPNNAAITNLPSDYPNYSGTYDIFPGFSAAAAGTTLSTLDGLSPNGIWSLYVYDDTPGNDGVIAKGWSLGLTAVNTVNPSARLAASMIHAPDPVLAGNYLTYQITVTNLGPSAAQNLTVTDPLPSGVTYYNATVSQGSNTINNGTVTCNLGTLNVGATATVLIQVIVNNTASANLGGLQSQLSTNNPSARSASLGSIVNTATVSTTDTQLYLADNTASNTTQVALPLFGLSAAVIHGGVQLSLVGQPSQNYAIQISTNLVKWSTVVSTTTDLNGNYIYTDTSGGTAERFYRAVLLPQ